MTAILGLLLSKVGVYLWLAVACVGVLFAARRSGVKAEQSAEMGRTIADTHTAAKVSAGVARESDAQVKADLDREFSR